MKWRVSQAWEPGVDVVAPIAGYPSLGVTFEYDQAGLLVGIVHELEVDDALHAGDAIRESDSRLRSLWALLEFLRGCPLPKRSPRAQRVLPPPPPGHASLEEHVILSVTCTGTVSRRVRFPSDVAAASVDPRLLERANGARDEEDHAHALRDYYAILEEIGAARPPELKHVRDFVSHGVLRNVELLAYVQREIGDPTVDRYDPADARHVRLVSRWRTTTMELVDRELLARLR